MGPADVIIICCYALGSLGSFLGLFPRCGHLRKPAAWAIAAGFLVHSAVIPGAVFSSGLENLSKSALLQLMAWSLVLVYCVAWRVLRYAALGITAGPLALALFLVSGAVRGVDGGLPETMTGLFFVLHPAFLFLNLALVTLGLGSALYFLWLHNKLKSKAIITDSSGSMLALATVDRVNKYVVLAGFPLFTVGVAAGFGWARLARGEVFTPDPQEIVSLLLWLLYAYIFVQRAVFRLQGRRAARQLVILFLALIVSLIGVNVFMNSHHSLFRTGMF